MPSIYYPVKPFYVNQHFGENYPCVKDFGLSDQSIIVPEINEDNTTTCPMGYDHLYDHWGMKGHNGTDLMAGEQPVYAAMDGVVVEQQLVPARGLGLGILSNQKYDFGALGTHFLKLRYWHLKSFTKNAGDIVKVGDVIGISNNTGYSSGNHLHFEGNLMDKDAGGHPILLNGDNGYFGAINIEQYFNGQYAQDVVKPYVFTRNLGYGYAGNDVIQLQKRLGVIPTWYIFGPKTYAAVVAYQKAHGITPTGFVGPLTRASLNGN